MKHNSLIIAGASEKQARAEKAPSFTDSWHPIPHSEVLDAMAFAVKSIGLKVVKKEYSLKPGSQLYATWEISLGDKEMNFGILIVNSIDKSRSVALSAYERIFICSNFCFRVEQETVMFRRHTGMLEMGEVQYMATESLKALVPRFKAIAAWRENLKELPVSISQAALLTSMATKRGVIPPTQFNKFFDLYQGQGSKYNNHKGTMWAWHGAVTELMNENSIPNIMDRQDRLNYFIDYEAPTLIQLSDKPTIGFKAEVEDKGYAKYLKDREGRKLLVDRSKIRHDYSVIRKSQESE